MYFFAGLGFVVSATFTLALAVERGFVQEDSLLAWLLVGVVSIPSLFFGIMWRRGIHVSSIIFCDNDACLISFVGCIF